MNVKHSLMSPKNKRHEDIANHFNEVYERSTISKILAQSDRWRVINTEDSAQTFRYKEVKFPVFEHAMSLWVENAIAGGVSFKL
jgi:hypothetical protein